MGNPPPINQHMPPGPHMPPPGPHMPPAPQRGPPQAQHHQMPPGYPPQPGYPTPHNQPGPYGHPGHGGAPGYGQPGQQYPSQPNAQEAKRLDPEHMPSPIQVMTENQRAISGPFCTNQAGLVPPLVTTNFITHDQGNSGPKFIRSTMYNVPGTIDIMKQTSVPFSLIISPFAKINEGEIQPPIVDFGTIGPIRCGRCKAYMSPNMQFIDAGRRFQCLLCKATSEGMSQFNVHDFPLIHSFFISSTTRVLSTFRPYRTTCGQVRTP